MRPIGRPCFARPLDFLRQRLGVGVLLPALVGLGLLAGCQPRPTPPPALPVDERELPQPKVVSSDGPSVDYALVIEMKEWVKEEGRLMRVPDGTPEALKLRTYGSPKDRARAHDRTYLAEDDNLEWTIPGPTFRIRHGQGFNLKLVNRLPVQDDERCWEGSPDYDVFPDCFHGDNTTNLHYHGFRVSPERPQDWVFLRLRPEGSEPGHDPNVVVGEFDFELDPLQAIQPVGTHWYHPHKHGSTALQVVNGMAGASLVDGYFNAFLEEQLPGLEERVMVVQQINETFPFPDRSFSPDQSFWVNGRKDPVITVRPGEIQWWRFVGATQQASAQILLTFPFEARQIAQDGVPFDNENYDRQPLNLARPEAFLRRSLVGLADRAFPESGASPLLQLAAGNRVDVLIRAPVRPGDYPVTVERTGALAQEVMQDLLAVAEDALVTLRVAEVEPVEMEFPRLPELPEYLRDIDRVEEEVEVVFSMDKGPGAPPPQFFIDGKKYDPNRIDHCVYLDRNEEWLIRNEAPDGVSPIAHPFHIHVNPFQIVALNGEPVEQPWIWWDTIALPAIAGGTVTIRQRFMGFAGEYVLHCHILGHEDRGMMQNVLARRLPVTSCP